MIVDKVHKRKVVEIESVIDAVSECTFMTWKLISECQLKPTDKITLDVVVLVERGA